MARSRRYVTEYTSVDEITPYGKREKREVQTSWPRGRKEDRWLMLIGDCLFSSMCKDFEDGSLFEADLPLIITVRRGKFRTVTEYVRSRIPPSVRMIIVHLGANDLASTALSASTVSDLCKLWAEICRNEENLEEVSLCHLSPRVVDKARFYSKKYIDTFNKRVVDFNKAIPEEASPLSFIDLGAHKEELTTLLVDSGFNATREGRGLVADCLKSLIKFKVNSSRTRGALSERLIQPADEGKRLIIREKAGVGVGFYRMPNSQRRLSLERHSAEFYRDTEIPEFEDDFKCGKKRKVRPYPAEGLKAFKKSRRES